MAGFQIPRYFGQLPPLIDDLKTQTSTVQGETIEECLPLLNAVNDASLNPSDFNEFGLPILEREKHVEFLQENLLEFPHYFVTIDASRPWMVYWALLGLHLLGEDVSTFRSR
jgi:protein farnesyltransferase subunit beta